MGLRRGLSLAWRFLVGLLLAGALVYVTRFIDWQSPRNAFLRPLGFPMIGLIALLSALLTQSFSQRFGVDPTVPGGRARQRGRHDRHGPQHAADSPVA
jgi:hypothetical protein